MTIRVLPRTESSGEGRGNVFLVLPDEPANPGYVLIYDPNYGHNEASLDWVYKRSRPARPGEYERLTKHYGAMNKDTIIVGKRGFSPRRDARDPKGGEIDYDVVDTLRGRVVHRVVGPNAKARAKEDAEARNRRAMPNARYRYVRFDVRPASRDRSKPRRDYLVSGSGRPHAMLGAAVKEAKALSLPSSYGGVGGEVPVFERTAYTTREIGRARRGTFFETGRRRDPQRRRSPYETLIVIQGNYGGRWEDVTAETNWKDARANLKAYRENESVPFRAITRRVHRQTGEAYKRSVAGRDPRRKRTRRSRARSR